jgi:hypothetical protein
VAALGAGSARTPVGHGPTGSSGRQPEHEARGFGMSTAAGSGGGAASEGASVALPPLFLPVGPAAAGTTDAREHSKRPVDIDHRALMAPPSSPDREIVLLRVVAGAPIPAVVAALGVTPAAIRRAEHRALSALQPSEILEAFDLTRCAHSAAELAGVHEKAVVRYVAIRDTSRDPFMPLRRARSIDPFLSKIEELVDSTQGRIRADVVHQRLLAIGFSGTDRTTRRAVAEVKATWKAGPRRKYGPSVPEPEMWTGVRSGENLSVGGRQMRLFCTWSRFRAVAPARDQRPWAH